MPGAMMHRDRSEKSAAPRPPLPIWTRFAAMAVIAAAFVFGGALRSELFAATVGDVAWKSGLQEKGHLRLGAQIYLEKGDKHVRVYLRRVAVEGGLTRDLTIHQVDANKSRPHLEQVCSSRFFEVKTAEVKVVHFDVARSDLMGEGLLRKEEAAFLLEIESRGKVVLSLQVDRPTAAVFPEQKLLRFAGVGPPLSEAERQAFEFELDSRLRNDSDDPTRRTSRARISLSFDRRASRRQLGETVVESICFVTNRERIAAPAKGGKWTDTFGVEPSKTITFGRVDVAIPGQLIVGRFKDNSTLPVDPLQVTRRFESTALDQDALHELLADAADDDVLVYVHGYNNRFEEALQRAAQLKHEMGFEGSVIAFCWPSLGETFVTRSIEAAQENPSLLDRMVSPLSKPYLRDLKAAADSQPAFTRLLKHLLERRRESGGSARIHLLAHSMGNRLMLGSLHELELAGAFCEEPQAIENVILFAPDVSVEDFQCWRGAATRASRRLTHYYSTEDIPLLLSQKVNRDRRAGLCRVECLRGEEADTICVDDINSYFSGLGHLYYGNSRAVLRDLHYLVVMGMTAQARSFHLTATSADDLSPPLYRFTTKP